MLTNVASLKPAVLHLLVFQLEWMNEVVVGVIAHA
jgi:hypothetical protein